MACSAKCPIRHRRVHAYRYGNDVYNFFRLRWNGKDLPTTPIENRSHFVVGLNATVSTTDLIQPRDVNITIFSLGPGGGASAPAIFRILPRQSSLLLKARYPAKRRAKKTFAVTI